MKVISMVDDLGLTKGKKYEVIEKSAGHYKVRLDNGNISYRRASLFAKDIKGQAAAGP